jgi:hypothetical protein
MYECDRTTSSTVRRKTEVKFAFRKNKVDFETATVKQRKKLTLALAGIFALDALRVLLPIPSSGIGSESEPSASPSSLLLNSSSSSEKSATRSANRQNRIRHAPKVMATIHIKGLPLAFIAASSIDTAAL